MGKQYSHDMSKESNVKALLPEGERKLQIIDCDEQISKSGNDMFKFQILDVATQQVDDIYAIATPGKRWFLKMILAACGVPASEDGIYEWDIADVLNQFIIGRIEHFDDEYINRRGATVKVKKHKVVEVKEFIGEGQVEAPGS